MYNQTHLEAMKEEMAQTDQANRELKAQNNALLNVLHDIVNLECCMMDQGSYIASEAIKKTPKQSLEENNAMVIELFKQKICSCE